MKYFSASGIPLRRGTPFSAGLDVPYYDPDRMTVDIQPGEVVKLPTGIFLETAPGTVAFADSRSSTSKIKLDLLCRTIDSDYRGEIYLVFINAGDKIVTVTRGDYLAQIIEIPCYMAEPTRVNDRSYLSITGRGDGGFGSTDNKKGEIK